MNLVLRLTLHMLFLAGFSPLLAQNSPSSMYAQARVLQDLGYYQRAMDLAEMALEADGNRNRLPEAARDLVSECREMQQHGDNILGALSVYRSLDQFTTDSPGLFRRGNFSTAEAVAKAQALIEFANDRADSQEAKIQALNLAAERLLGELGENRDCQKCREDFVSIGSNLATNFGDKTYADQTRREFENFLEFERDDADPVKMEACNGEAWLDYLTFLSRLGKNDKLLNTKIAIAEQSLKECESDSRTSLKEILILRLELRLRQRQMPSAGEIALEILDSNPEDTRSQYLYVNTIFESVFSMQLHFDSLAGARDHVAWRAPYSTPAFQEQINDSIDIHFNLGKKFRNARNWSKSAYHFGKSYMFAGTTYTAKAFMESAVEASRLQLADDIARSLSREQPKASILKIAINASLDQPERADLQTLKGLIDKYSSMVPMTDGSLLVINTRYDLMFGSGSPQKVLSTIKAHKSRYGNSREVNEALAIYYDELDKPKKSIKYYQASAKYSSRDQHLVAAEAVLQHMRQGSTVQKGGKTTREAERRKGLEALDHLKWAEKSSANDTLLNELMAEAYFLAAEPEKAMRYYAQSMKYRLLEPESCLKNAACLYGTGQYEACLDSLNAMEARGDVHFLSGSAYYDYQGLRAMTLCSLHAIKSPNDEQVKGYQTYNELKAEVAAYVSDFDMSEDIDESSGTWKMAVGRSQIPVQQAAAHHLLAKLYLTATGGQKTDVNDPVIGIASTWLPYSWLPEEMLYPNPMIDFCAEKNPKYNESINREYFR